MTKNRFRYVANLLIVMALSLILPINTSAVEDDTAQAKVLRIGILSKRGPLMVQQRWSEMTVYLQQKIPEYQFDIVPLSFEAVRPAVQNKQIDFLLTNSGMYVDLSFSFELFAIATLKRKIISQPYTKFGSVIFTRIERDGIDQLKDLAATDIAAVNKQSLGGWIAALRELDSIGFSLKTVNSLDFLGTHDAVVYAVENRTVDVGIVKTDTLERMAAEHKIQLGTFKVLPLPKEQFRSAGGDPDFPLMRSTRLYPEWPIISLAHVSKSLTEKMSSALLVMPEESKAAIDAQIMGWTIPQNYTEVDHAFKQLSIGHYQTLNDRSILEHTTHHWKNILVGLLITSLIFYNLRYISSINRQLKTAQQNLIDFSDQDPLTGLPNRLLFFDLVNRYLHIALREQNQCILLALSVCDIGSINNQYSYEMGEKVFLETKNRIKRSLTDNDLLSKMDGNKFLILLTNNQSVNHFRGIMQTIVDSFNSPFTSENGFEIKIDVCIGASQYPRNGTILNKLILHADEALQKAKILSNNNTCVYSEN